MEGRKETNIGIVLSVTDLASTFFSPTCLFFSFPFQMLFMVFDEDGYGCFLILLSFTKATLVVCVEGGLTVRDQCRGNCVRPGELMEMKPDLH